MNELNMLYANIWFYVPVMIWVLFWKGCALWFAVKNEKKWWFLALLVLNTFGLLEIVYIFIISKKNLTDIKELFSKKETL